MAGDHARAIAAREGDAQETGAMRFRLIDIELAEPIVSPDGLDGYAAVRALVRMHGAPLGFIDLPVERGSCSPERLREAIAQQLERELLAHLKTREGRAETRQGLADPGSLLRDSQLHELAGEPPPPHEGPWPSMTIAICTRDRPADLALCLDSVTALEYPGLEVLVVDNAPGDDSTERLVAARHPRVRYTCERRPGLDRARNHAVREAVGEVIAFTDDDVIVDPGWALALGAAFATASPDVMAVAGAVVPFELETDAQLHFERYGGFTIGFERAELRGGEDWGVRGVWHYANMAQRFTGANLAFRRRVFDEVGLFDPALDVGTATNGGGDIEMLFRVLKEGYAIVYEPRALVRHRHRREPRDLEHQISGWGTGYTAFLMRSALAYPAAAWVLLLLGVRGFWNQLGRLAASLADSPGFPRRLLLTEAIGQLRGPLCFWRSRRRGRILDRGRAPERDRVAR
jgi:GT2 family glycosyltransferase